jgi:SchA/CurD like domain
VRDESGNQVGTVLSTQVFMKDDLLIRVIQFEGPVPAIARHMSRQQATLELEEKLEEHLADHRDMSTPEGVRKFSSQAGMRLLVSRQVAPRQPLE